MRHIIAFTAFLTLVPCAWAAEPSAIALSEGPPLTAGVAAFPRITAPLTPATSKIDAALARADERAIAAVKACAANAGPQPAGAPPAWSRTVSVTIRTKRLISFIATDEIFCGGAHPDSGITALVYDVTTGAPVNWLPAFPASLAVTAASDSGIDGTRLGLIRSPKLLAWFETSLTDDGTGDCQGVGDETSGFTVWPDPKAGGLAIFAQGVDFADAPCAGPVDMPYATLAAFGFVPSLIAELKIAQADKRYGPSYRAGN